MGHLRVLVALGALLTLPGCAPAADAAAGPAPRAEEVATPERAGAASDTAAADAVATTGPGAADGALPASAAEALLTYGEAYDLLYAAIEPSDELIEQWNAAYQAEDWALVRETSGRLADCLQTLQIRVLAAAWPADAQGAAQDFALALDEEIGWYSYVSIATDDEATVAALAQPWTDAAVTASDELWAILEAGLGKDR